MGTVKASTLEQAFEHFELPIEAIPLWRDGKADVAADAKSSTIAPSVAEVARHFEVSRRSVQDWFIAGCPGKLPDDTYNLEAITEWRQKRQRPGRKQWGKIGETMGPMARAVKVELDYINRKLPEEVAAAHPEFRKYLTSKCGFSKQQAEAAANALVACIGKHLQALRMSADEMHEYLEDRLGSNWI